jgi:casein kinase II subunit alpha
VQVLGTEELGRYLAKYGLSLDAGLTALIGEHTKKAWTKFINSDNEHLVSEESIDFLDRILRYDHAERLTCREAMAHHYFDPVRDTIMAAAQSEGAVDAAHL